MLSPYATQVILLLRPEVSAPLSSWEALLQEYHHGSNGPSRAVLLESGGPVLLEHRK